MRQDISSITIRTYRPEEDKNFIFATWLRGMYYGDSWFSMVPKAIFMSCYHKIVERFLSRPDSIALVACLKEDPSVVLGYSVYHKVENGSVLDFIFVKSAWRNIGIGRSLVPKDLVAVSHLTKVGKNLLAKYPGVIFNPF